jgi:hypothetical protein
MSKKASDALSRRRKDRANVANRLQGVFVRCERLAGIRELRVFNISEHGIGVDPQLVKDPPGPKEVLDGKLLVGRTVAPVKLKVVHMGKEVMGMEFVNPSELLSGAIQQYFEPELVGASLRESAASSPKKRIYESMAGSRIDILLNPPGVVESFSIRVLGNSVEWEIKSGLRLVQNGKSEPVPEFLLKQLVKFVKSGEIIDPDLRNQLEAVLAGTYGLESR